MNKLHVVFLLLTLVCAASINAQTPTGAIAGVVRDPSGAAVTGALVKLTHLSTRLTRAVTTSVQGNYSFPTLHAGEYELSTEVEAFAPIIRPVTVEAGVTTNADIDLVLDRTNESIIVPGASPQMRFDSHTVGGVVTQRQIQGLPLNGRSFLEFAKLEPGVQAPGRAVGSRTFVPALGQPQGNNGRGTRVTVDGGSIMAVGSGGSMMGFSQEGVQEFHIATVNFDLTTGLTNGAAINVVTRHGGNELHGTAFYFFRDHTLAAYPELRRDPANPDPFFQRRQFGFALGGAIWRDRLFFFGNYERNEQRGVWATTISNREFAHLSGITPSPYFGNQVSLRLDARLTDAHMAFLRYSHDGARSFGTTETTAYPSSWALQPLWADQSILGLASSFSKTLVNDFRFSYFYVNHSQTAPTDRECPGCLGLGAPSITVAQVGLSIGRASSQSTLARRYHLSDYVTWQRASHRARFGVDWEYNRGGTIPLNNEPASLVLFSPDQARKGGIPVPASFRRLEDLLQLPLQSARVDIGDARVAQEDGGLVPNWSTVRLFFQDTWRLNSRLTINYGLGWNVDHALNDDLRKPALLAPILGAGGLGPSRTEWKNFSPVLGLAWSPKSDGKSVIRSGAGIFYDWVFNPNVQNERSSLGPAGSGRQEIPASGLWNCLPGIPGVPVERNLDFQSTPTVFTGADFLTCLPAIRAELARNLFGTADQTIQAIELSKVASGLNPVVVPTSSALHVNAGIQREIMREFVVSADFVYRHFTHVGMGQPDLNHFNSARGPVIRECLPAERNDPAVLCSNGAIKMQANGGVATYKGLLLRADKRFSRGFQLTASWAYSSNTGTNSTGATTAFAPGFNLDDWLSNHGPHAYDTTHIVNLAGVVQLPWRLQLGFNFSYASAPPFSAFVDVNDFNGDGTKNDLLPGTTVNAFNHGLDRRDLERLVAEFNQSHAGKLDRKGQLIPKLSLPERYWFGDNFQALDMRLSREFVFEKRWHLLLIGEAFNVYNAANLSGHSGNLASTARFGQPTSRATQVFGSGGSRAFQLALRLSF